MSYQAKRQSASAQAEDRLLAAEIAKSNRFAACIHLGPGNRQKIDDLPSYEAAQDAATELNKLSQFGRKAVIYAITKLGSFPCDDRLVALSRSL